MIISDYYLRNRPLLTLRGLPPSVAYIESEILIEEVFGVVVAGFLMLDRFALFARTLKEGLFRVSELML